MNKEFLESSNFNFLVNTVRNDVRQRTQYDILSNKQYVNLFKKLVQMINKNNVNKNTSKEYLNNLVIEKCVPFLVKQIQTDKTNGKDRIFNISTPKINTMDRPKELEL